MEFPQFGSVLLKLESILLSIKNLEPFLNIYEESGVLSYRLIIVLKTLFVLNALNTAIPLKWSMYSMLIGLMTVEIMKHVTFEAYFAFVLLALGFYGPSMTIMCMISMSYKPYEFLLDIFTLLCTLYYATEAYRKEIWKLCIIILICLFQAWLTFKILSSQSFDFTPYLVVLCFSRLYYCLKPSEDIFQNRLLYFNIVMHSWVLYKVCQHYDRTHFAPPQAEYRPDVCMLFERELMIGKCYLNSSLESLDEDFDKTLNPRGSKSFDSDFRVNFQKVSPAGIPNVKKQKGHDAEMFNYGATRTDEKSIDSDELMKNEMKNFFEPFEFHTDNIWNQGKGFDDFSEESFIDVLSNADDIPLDLAHLDQGAEENNEDNSKRDQEERNVDSDNAPCETCQKDEKVSLLNDNSVINKRFGHIKSVKKNQRLENKKNNLKKLNYKVENVIADFDYIDEVPSKYGSYPDNYSKNRKNKKINKTQIKGFKTTLDKRVSWISAEHQAKKTGNSTEAGTTKVGFKVKDGKTVETRARSKTAKNSKPVVNKIKLPKIKQTRAAFKATKHDTPEFEENKIIQTYLI